MGQGIGELAVEKADVTGTKHLVIHHWCNPSYKNMKLCACVVALYSIVLSAITWSITSVTFSKLKVRSFWISLTRPDSIFLAD
jgi:hypothetical protein